MLSRSVAILIPIALIGCGNEQVDAHYYPNKTDMTKSQTFEDVGSIDNCRAVVRQAAAANGDPNLDRGDYECGIGPTGQKLGDVSIYSRTEK